VIVPAVVGAVNITQQALCVELMVLSVQEAKVPEVLDAQVTVPVGTLAVPPFVGESVTVAVRFKEEPGATVLELGDTRVETARFATVKEEVPEAPA
jgi:hypothetical protein